MASIWQADEEAAVPLLRGSELREESSVGVEERSWLLRRQEQPGWRVDHGAGIYQEDREKRKRAYLVETGRWVLWLPGGPCCRYQPCSPCRHPMQA